MLQFRYILNLYLTIEIIKKSTSQKKRVKFGSTPQISLAIDLFFYSPLIYFQLLHTLSASFLPSYPRHILNTTNTEPARKLQNFAVLKS